MDALRHWGSWFGPMVGRRSRCGAFLGLQVEGGSRSQHKPTRPLSVAPYGHPCLSSLARGPNHQQKLAAVAAYEHGPLLRLLRELMPASDHGTDHLRLPAYRTEHDTRTITETRSRQKPTTRLADTDAAVSLIVVTMAETRPLSNCVNFSFGPAADADTRCTINAGSALD